jgi:cyclophilin family peptidyl-prolyl cis-trans isomerase/HEAT repeat protein
MISFLIRIQDKLFILFLIISISTSCLPVKKEKISAESVSIHLDFEDVTNRLVYNWQDRLMTDSLLIYFSHSSPKKRLIATLAFGSIPDSTAIPKLGEMLYDEDLQVRVAAAYSLGQIGNLEAEKLLISAWIDNDQTLGYAAFNSMILESVGKCGSLASLKHITEMDKLVPTDTLLLLGQVRGMYRFLLRGITHPNSSKLIVEYLENKAISHEVKLVAANYLARASAKEFEIYLDRMIKLFNAEIKSDLQQPLITAIGKQSGTNIKNLLIKLAKDEQKDYRIRVNAIKALSNHAGEDTEQLMDNLLFDERYQIQLLASKYFIDHGVGTRAVYYYNRSKSIETSDYISKYGLMGAALKYMPATLKSYLDSISNSLKIDFGKNNNSFVQSMIISAMSYDLNNMVFLKSIMYSERDVLIRSTAATALGNLAKNKHFDAFFKSYAPESRAFIAKYLSLTASDPQNPLLAPAAQALIDAGPALWIYVPDTIDFKNTLELMVLPKQSEDYEILSQLIKLMQPDNDPPKALSPTFNNPIDWDLFAGLSDSTVVSLLTSRGNIDILLFKNAAPGSVCNFIRMIQADYYQNKIFHRIEPNFVIQGGCTRGDGYGSLDWSIRTETPPLYYDQEGLVGMASIGRHTESQQFFITHSAAMHLDGKYTIMGKVISGMDVVHKMKAGDKIEDVIIRKSL